MEMEMEMEMELSFEMDLKKRKSIMHAMLSCTVNPSELFMCIKYKMNFKF